MPIVEAAEGHSDDAAAEAPAPVGRAVRRSRRRALNLMVVIALVVAAHAALGGLVFTAGPWKHWAVGAVLVIILLHLLGGLVVRRRKARTAQPVSPGEAD
ncbi:DUF2754 family protein [Micromonospora sp. 15K316]|uniref:DUF2754 family protein n=1 Tax=Micromonospora sp. 15K316 TaxID=2530376 RepID=UPI001053954E|nr:DUF2754 family protein [Micromonospora sp. 15K316]TDC27961.1 DUF2754 family protein [Micromonospora sp. 15K316]